MKKRFIILFVGHSGSSWLCDTLSRQPNLGYLPNEPLSKIVMRLGRNSTQHACYLRDFLFFEPIDRIIKIHEAFGIPLNSDVAERLHAAQSLFFKARFDEFPTSPDGLTWLQQCRTPLVRLGRRNKIKHAISHIKRNDLDLGHFKFKEILPPIYLDPRQIEERITRLKTSEAQSDELIHRLDVPVLQLAYEDLFDDIQEVVRRVLDFAQISYDPRDIKIESEFKKVTHDDLRHALANYEEVRSYFENTPQAIDLDG